MIIQLNQNQFSMLEINVELFTILNLEMAIIVHDPNNRFGLGLSMRLNADISLQRNNCQSCKENKGNFFTPTAFSRWVSAINS